MYNTTAVTFYWFWPHTPSAVTSSRRRVGKPGRSHGANMSSLFGDIDVHRIRTLLTIQHVIVITVELLPQHADPGIIRVGTSAHNMTTMTLPSRHDSQQPSEHGIIAKRSRVTEDADVFEKSTDKDNINIFSVIICLTRTSSHVSFFRGMSFCPLYSISTENGS